MRISSPAEKNKYGIKYILKIRILKFQNINQNQDMRRNINGLLHLIPVPPLSRTSFSKGEISHFFQRGNWEKWKKNALSRGVKKQKCTSRGGSSLFQRGQLHFFFLHSRGVKSSKAEVLDRGGLVF
jgi:hypothetical protein